MIFTKFTVAECQSNCAEINSPKLNIEIENGQQFKVAEYTRPCKNKHRKELLENSTNSKENQNELPIDLTKIKLLYPEL